MEKFGDTNKNESEYMLEEARAEIMQLAYNLDTQGVDRIKRHFDLSEHDIQQFIQDEINICIQNREIKNIFEIYKTFDYLNLKILYPETIKDLFEGLIVNNNIYEVIELIDRHNIKDIKIDISEDVIKSFAYSFKNLNVFYVKKLFEVFKFSEEFLFNDIIHKTAIEIFENKLYTDYYDTTIISKLFKLSKEDIDKIIVEFSIKSVFHTYYDDNGQVEYKNTIIMDNFNLSRDDRKKYFKSIFMDLKKIDIFYSDYDNGKDEYYIVNTLSFLNDFGYISIEEFMSDPDLKSKTIDSLAYFLTSGFDSYLSDSNSVLNNCIEDLKLSDNDINAVKKKCLVFLTKKHIDEIKEKIKLLQIPTTLLSDDLVLKSAKDHLCDVRDGFLDQYIDFFNIDKKQINDIFKQNIIRYISEGDLDFYTNNKYIEFMEDIVNTVEYTSAINKGLNKLISECDYYGYRKLLSFIETFNLNKDEIPELSSIDFWKKIIESIRDDYFYEQDLISMMPENIIKDDQIINYLKQKFIDINHSLESNLLDLDGKSIETLNKYIKINNILLQKSRFENFDDLSTELFTYCVIKSYINYNIGFVDKIMYSDEIKTRERFNKIINNQDVIYEILINTPQYDTNLVSFLIGNIDKSSEGIINSEDIRNKMGDLVIRCIETNNVEYKNIIDVFKFSDDFLLSKEFQSAVKANIISLIKIQPIDTLLDRVREFKLSDEDIDDIGRLMIIKKIGNITIDDIYKLKKEFKISDEDIQDIIKEGAIESFNVPDLKNILRIIQEFKLSDDDIRDIGRQGVRSYLTMTYLDVNTLFLNIKYFKLSDEDIQDIVKQSILEKIQGPYSIFQILDMIQGFKISNDFILSKEVQNAIKENIISFLLKGEGYEAMKIKNEFMISDEIMLSKDVQIAAQTAFSKNIETFEFDNALDIIQEFKLSGEYIESEGFKTAIKKIIVYKLKRHQDDTISDIIKEYKISDEDVLDAVKQHIIYGLNNMNYKNVLTIIEKYKISDEDVLDAVKQSIEFHLKEGQYNYALNIIKEFKLEKKEFKDKVIEYVIDLITQNKISEIETIFNKFDLSKDELHSKFVKDILVKKPIKTQIMYILHTKYSDTDLAKTILNIENIVKFNPNLNNQNNIWVSDILPLLESVVADVINNTEDINQELKYVESYIKTLGPVNNRYLYDIFKRMLTKTMNDKDIEDLNLLGVKDISTLTVGMFKQIVDRVQIGILNDEISIKSDIVYSIFKTRYLLSSSFDRQVSKSDWLNYEKLDDYALPSFLKERQTISFEEEEIIAVSLEDLDKYLSSKEVEECLSSQHELILSGKHDFETIIKDQISAFRLTINSLRYKLNNDEKIKSNEKIQQGILKQIENINNLIDKINSIETKNIKKIIKELLSLNNKELSKLIKVLIISDILNSSDFQGYRAQLCIDKIDNKEEYIRILQDMYSHGLEHHYWVDKFFDQKIIELFKKSLGLVEFKKGKTIIDHIWSTIESLKTGNITKTQTVDIDLIPVEGLARLTAGNIGDACYTSKVYNMVNDSQLDNVHAFLFSKKDSFGNDSFKGSVLLLETKDKDTQDTLFLVRANNPREGFLMSMSEESRKRFVLQTIEKLKKYVEKYTLNTGKKARLAIVKDRSSSASTNRPSVAEIYKGIVIGKDRVYVDKNSVTNFNGYRLDEYNDNEKGLYIV